MTAPLTGIRVVEIASFVAAPAAGALLADLGAEVIKVEVPGGEVYRNTRPRMLGFQSDFDAAPHFQMDNRGKRSLALDLTRLAALTALGRVIDRADVVLTNMLPERLERFGLDPESLRGSRPDLIVARLTGYGPEGPEANTPSFDYAAFWARSGLMHQLREPDSPPAWLRPGMGDHSASLALSTGILAALRTRDRGEGGQVIDVSLLHIGFYIEGNDATMTLVTGETPPMHDRRNPRNPLWNHYRTADDRWLFLVMIESDRYWHSFLRTVDRTELLEDERFDGAVARYRNSSALVQILDAVFAERKLDEWIDILGSERLIWAPVRTLAEAVDDPQAVDQGSFPTVEHPRLGDFRTVAPPLRMSRHDMPGTAPAPELGADGEAVLREAGLTPDEIRAALED
jgi:crotonobetainyl-CoA:carnitine CoA-transferase CaiB-like acyl-CoA transferase